MRQTIAIGTLGVAFLGLGGSGVAGQATHMTTLRQLRGHARPLLIFAPTPFDPTLRIQLRTLDEHAAEVKERDVVAVALPFRNPGPTEAQLPADEAEAVRRRFHVGPGDFVVILLGKDGGAKLRSTKPFSMQTLNDTIDAMPMRQDEMRHPDR